MPPFGLRTRTASVVYVNVYDLAEVNEWVYPLGLGVYHAGIEVDGLEYTFSDGGVYDHAPREAPARYRESFEIGTFDGGPRGVQGALSDLRQKFGPGQYVEKALLVLLRSYYYYRYNLVCKNCCTFSEEFALALTGKPIPSFINRLAWIGSFFTWFLPASMFGAAPVTDEASAPLVPKKTFNAFGGSGATLASPSGGGGGGGGQGGSSGGEAERRARVRAAALARMEGTGSS